MPTPGSAARCARSTISGDDSVFTFRTMVLPRSYLTFEAWSRDILPLTAGSQADGSDALGRRRPPLRSAACQRRRRRRFPVSPGAVFALRVLRGDHAPRWLTPSVVNGRTSVSCHLADARRSARAMVRPCSPMPTWRGRSRPPTAGRGRRGSAGAPGGDLSRRRTSASTRRRPFAGSLVRNRLRPRPLTAAHEIRAEQVGTYHGQVVEMLVRRATRNDSTHTFGASRCEPRRHIEQGARVRPSIGSPRRSIRPSVNMINTIVDAEITTS